MGLLADDCEATYMARAVQAKQAAELGVRQVCIETTALLPEGVHFGTNRRRQREEKEK